MFFVLEKYLHWHHCSHEESCDCKMDKERDIKTFGYVNLFGDAIHNIIDGIVIAGSYMLDIGLGIATTLAVIMHEIPQELGDFGVLLHAGFSKKKALFFNFLSALTSIIGALGALYLQNYIESVEMYIMAFTAGTFVYIAGSDLIPELHKERDLFKSFMQLLSILLGIAIMYAILFINIH